MRHLVHAMKIMINDDLRARDRGKVRRAPRRSEAVAATKIEPLIQSAAVRSPEVVRSRKTASVST